MANSERVTTTTLLAGIRTGDNSAWQRVMRVYAPLVHHWVRKAGLQFDDADDIVQQVFAAASQGIEGYRDSREVPHTFRRWLWGIARNHVNDFLREQEQQPRAAGGTNANLRMQQMPSDPFEDSDPAEKRSAFAGLARRALELLKLDFEPQTWRMFHRTVIEGEPTAEVAADMGVTTKAIRQARYRVLKRLREELGNDFPDSNVSQ